MSNNGKEGHEDFVFHRTLSSSRFLVSLLNPKNSFFSRESSLICHAVCEFASTFSVRTEISDALKFCLRAMREVAGEAVIVTRWSLRKQRKKVLWDTNRGLAAIKPRLTRG